MSSNAVAAMAVILVSGFAGCAATARASETATPAAIILPAERPESRVIALAGAAHAPIIATLARAAR